MELVLFAVMFDAFSTFRNSSILSEVSLELFSGSMYEFKNECSCSMKIEFECPLYVLKTGTSLKNGIISERQG